MTELITGSKGSAHVTSAQQGAINAAVFGAGAYVISGCAASMTNANTLHIAAGYLMVQGRAVAVTATDLTIDSGSQGVNRHDLACVSYVNTAGVETATLAIVKGTAATSPVDPTVAGNILSGDTSAHVAIWRVVITGITPAVATIVSTFYPSSSTSGIITPSNGDWSVGSQKLTRNGDIVTVEYAASYVSTSILGGVYATLPDGFRPVVDTVFSACPMSTGPSYVLGLAKITSSGGVYLYSNGVSVHDAAVCMSFNAGTV